MRKYAYGLALALSLIGGVASAERIKPNEERRVEAHGVCRVVTNTGKSAIMVPTNRAAEWSVGRYAFLNNQHKNLELAACTCPADQRNYGQTQIIPALTRSAVTQDAKFIAGVYTGNSRPELQIHDTSAPGKPYTLSQTLTLPNRNLGGVVSMAFSDDGEYLKVVMDDARHRTYKKSGTSWALHHQGDIRGSAYASGIPQGRGHMSINKDGTVVAFEAPDRKMHILNAPHSGDWRIQAEIDTRGAPGFDRHVSTLHPYGPTPPTLNGAGDTLMWYYTVLHYGAHVQAAAVYTKASDGTWSLARYFAPWQFTAEDGENIWRDRLNAAWYWYEMSGDGKTVVVSTRRGATYGYYDKPHTGNQGWRSKSSIRVFRKSGSSFDLVSRYAQDGVGDYHRDPQQCCVVRGVSYDGKYIWESRNPDGNSMQVNRRQFWSIEGTQHKPLKPGLLYAPGPANAGWIEDLQAPVQKSLVAEGEVAVITDRSGNTVVFGVSSCAP